MQIVLLDCTLFCALWQFDCPAVKTDIKTLQSDICQDALGLNSVIPSTSVPKGFGRKKTPSKHALLTHHLIINILIFMIHEDFFPHKRPFEEIETMP